MTQSAAAQKPPATPRRLDPEDAQHALAEVQERLRRQQLVADLVHRQEEGDAKANLVEDLVHRQHEAELKTLLDGLHPADIAFILESLPKDERQAIWKLVSPEHDADVLLEVEDWVRESLIEAMDRQDLVAATGNMDADELADLAPDLPPDLRARVLAIDLTVPAHDVYFRADPVGLAYLGKPDAHPLLAMRGVDWAPVVCVYGLEEKGSLCPSLAGRARVIGLSGAHYLGHDAPRLIATTLRALHEVAPEAGLQP